MQTSDYTNCTDEELIARCREGESAIMDFLMEKYKNLVRRCANALFLLGGEPEDLIQEGMIGLFKAVRDYDADKGSFYHFALLCINRQLYHAVETAARRKHTPLNSYISLSGTADEAPEAVLTDHLSDARGQNPESLILAQEAMQSQLKRLKESLSPLERTVFDYYLEGLNYRQIANQMGRPPKTIDNALQRIRAKAQRLTAD